MEKRLYRYPEILENWYVISENPAETEFAVMHYVQGEDCDIVDGYFPTRAEAEARRDVLNAKKLVTTFGVWPLMTLDEWIEMGGDSEVFEG